MRYALGSIADIHRSLLEVPSEVTLLAVEAQNENQEPRLESKEKTLQDID